MLRQPRAPQQGDLEPRAPQQGDPAPPGQAEPASRQTEPCLTKVVLNQISASTYGRIGRSADVSKYVMSGGEDGERSARWPVPGVEVEFREVGLEGEVPEGEEDFEVEFSAAEPRGGNTVNKISAGTFQQIGRTAGRPEESYVMRPVKSWSSVVGRGVWRAPAAAVLEGKAGEESSGEEDETGPKGEPNPYDRIRAKLKEGKEELTPEEREIVRQKRRDRRKREKENKKKEKEEAARKALLAPQTSKLHVVTREALAHMRRPAEGQVGPVGQGGGQERGVSFQEDEYPDLGARRPDRRERVLSRQIRDEAGRLCSDRESNSEWETEDERVEPVSDGAGEPELVTVTVSESGPVSYSSILKARKVVVAELPPAKTKGVIVVTEKMKGEMAATKGEETEKKKVKKKDPIEFDLFSALSAKRQQTKKNGQVLGGKIKKEAPAAKTVRNQLDSSAPSKKRGKEREGGKKKKKSLLKKIILEERLRKKTAREEAERRRSARIEAGVFLKPLSVGEDDTETQLKTELSRSFEEFHRKVDEDTVESNEKLPTESDTNREEKIPTESVTNPMTQSDKWTATEAKEEAKHTVVAVTEEEQAKEKIHSRRFRHYCSQLLTQELDGLAVALMGDLVRFQDKQHAKDPVKAKARRRYVVGLRETGKFLGVRKVVCLLLAPDLEQVEAKGGLDDAVTGLLVEAAKQEPPVPVVFALNRRRLGRACLRKVPVSCVGIMNPQGADETYKSLLELAASQSEQYKARLAGEVARLKAPPPEGPATRGPSPAPSLASLLSEHAPVFVPASQRCQTCLGLPCLCHQLQEDGYIDYYAYSGWQGSHSLWAGQ